VRHVTALLFVIAVGVGASLIPMAGLAAPSVPALTGIATLTLTMPDNAKVGQVVIIVAHLNDGAVPIAAASLQLAVDGNFRRVATNAGGDATLPVRDLHAGTHVVTASFDGRVGADHLYQPAFANDSFVMASLRLQIRAVPTVAGVGFTVTGNSFTQTLTTGAGGIVAFDIPVAGIANISVQLPPSDDRSRVTFSRWSDDAFIADRQIRLQGDVNIDCGLRISYLTSIEFFGLRGRTLDAGSVSNVELTGPNAEVIRLQAPYPPIWLTTPVPTRRSGQPGLHITPTPYAVTAGDYDGLNVINRGEQRFTPAPGATWRIELLLYDLRIRARDALFGTSYPYHDVIVTDPLGRTRQLVLDGDSQATMTAGRGMYLVHVIAPGISPAAPVALSRSQTATMPIISPSDIGLFFGSGILAMIVLFIAARRRRWLFRGFLGLARRLLGRGPKQGGSSAGTGNDGTVDSFLFAAAGGEPPGSLGLDQYDTAELAPPWFLERNRVLGGGFLPPANGGDRIDDRYRIGAPRIGCSELLSAAGMAMPNSSDRRDTTGQSRLLIVGSRQRDIANPSGFLQSGAPWRLIGHLPIGRRSVAATLMSIVRGPMSKGLALLTSRGGGTGRIRLLAPDLRITTRIAGYELRRPNQWVVVTDPVGRKRQPVLDGDGHPTVTAWREIYHVPVIAPGISPAAPVALLRGQATTVPIISRPNPIAGRRPLWIWRRLEHTAQRPDLKRA
jgi:hypothetical protein